MSSAEAFYRAERERWPELSELHITDEWARKALKKLTRHFKLDFGPFEVGAVPLAFRGRNVSWGGSGGIVLAKTRDWLTFLHEVAHVWEYRLTGDTRHRAPLALLVDQLCRYAISKGWAEADVAEQLDAWCAENDATPCAEEADALPY